MRKSDVKLVQKWAIDYLEPPFNRELLQPLMELALKLYTSGWVDGSNGIWDDE